jgi:hypothetical protein
MRKGYSIGKWRYEWKFREIRLEPGQLFEKDAQSRIEK